MKHKYRYLVVAGLSIAVAGGCNKKKSSSDGNSTSTQSTEKVNDVDGYVAAGTLQLQLSDTINIIPAKGSDGASLSLSELDDAKEKINYRVHELSLEGLNQVQGIMCFLAQTKYADMANQGPYMALVNESKCFKDGDANSGEKITRVKVDSTREDGKALHVKLWLPKDENGDGFSVDLKVAEGSSESNPVGIFKLNFGQGYIESRRNDAGEIEVSFYEADEHDGNSFKMQMAVRLVQDDSGNIVGGRMATASEDKWEDGSQSANFKVVFNDNVINRTGTANGETADACLDRNQYSSRAWNYNIYKADGSLWNLNSGFPIEWTEGSDTKRGYASYWGVNGDNGSDIGSGVTTVNRVEFKNGDKESTPFTIKSAPGKLYKYVKKTITLGELKGAELRQYTMDGTFIAKWDGSKFSKVAKVTYSDNGEERSDESGDVAAEWGGYRFNVESLGGDIFIPEGKAADSYTVSYFQRSMVSGSTEAPSEDLVCFDRCIEMKPTAEKFKENSWGPGASGPFIVTKGWDNQDSNSAKDVSTVLATYKWDGTNHNLMAGSDSFTLPDGLSSDNQNGASQQTGALVPKTVYSALANKTISPYELEQQIDLFYRFETGTQNWNRYTALIDADGKIFQFDQPVTFTYVHSKENDLNGSDDNEFYGQTFSLQYGGPGNLWGFPYEKDKDSGNTYSKFGLRAGATLSDGSVVVPVEVEQVLSEVDASQCAAVAIEGVPDLPTATPTAVDNGEEPSDDTAVKVSEGTIL